MAKENLVLLHGQVLTMPKILSNKDGKLLKGMFALKVLRRPINGGKSMANKIYIDAPIILTRNEELIKQISTFEKNDMIDVRGVISTKEVLKTTICPNCSHKNQIKGVTTYVTPIYMCKREANVSEEKGLALLKERAEISNLAMIIGTLCREPEIYIEEKTKHSFAQYQLAANRRYRIKEDSAEKRTDYPWVKTIGEQALKDSRALHVGSSIYISGALQTREIERNSQCSECGQSYSWNDNATEIVPYNIEYLANCDIEEKEGGEICQE